MSGAFEVGAIAMRTQQQALEALANNIANVNTSGFKRAQVRFADVVATRSDPARTVDAATRGEPDSLAGPDVLSGVVLDAQFMVNEQGELQRTGQAMDVAIEGAGFIELMGPDGQSLLWRGGRLKINDDGLLATDKGVALRAAISIPRDAAALEIGADGVVRTKLPDSEDRVELGQIQLVRVDDAAGLQRIDGGLYRAGDAVQLIEAEAGEDGSGRIVQGSIERSNVQLTDEMVQLMMVQRAYAANAQIVQAADQLMAIANGLKR